MAARSMSTFTLHDLEPRVKERAQASADVSYTRKLLDRGVAHCAKKLGEEAVETAIAAVAEDRERLIAETADLLYHLLVVLEARGIALAEVEAVLAERTAPVRPGREGGAVARQARSRKVMRSDGSDKLTGVPWTSAPTTASRPTAPFRAANGRRCAPTRR